MPWFVARAGFAVIFAACLLLPTGCNLLGAVAGKMPKPDIDAAYKGLANQTVGIMVWADRSTILIDWPSIQLDMGAMLQEKLKRAAPESKDDLKGISFPYEAASFVRYQRERPALEVSSITDVAPKLGVSRLIYVEVNSISTRAAESFALKLGQGDVTLKVIEVEGGKAKVAYEDRITVQYPKRSPKEGELNRTDRNMYVGTIDSLTTELALKFIRHPDDSR
jgi:hypothetical protein